MEKCIFELRLKNVVRNWLLDKNLGTEGQIGLKVW